MKILELIVHPFEYLFYRVYGVLQSEYLFPGLSKMEYRAAAIVGSMIWMNLASVTKILGYNVLNALNSEIIVFSAIIIVFLSMAYFCRSEKLQSILGKYNELKKIPLFDYLVISYVLLTLLVFIFSL